MTMTDSELTIKARGIASCLTYNDDDAQAAAKHMLHELSHRLDRLDIRVYETQDGLKLVNGLGATRMASDIEVELYSKYGVVPREI